MNRECICGPFDIDEKNGHSASCNRYNRKLETASLKPNKNPVRIKKVGTSNTFECSDGTRITQKEIQQLLNKAYKEASTSYLLKANLANTPILCEGCGELAQAHAHIIAQSRCKVIGKTELIWDKDNFFPACHTCNSFIENPKGQEWKKLKNIDKCLKFIEQHDGELYMKFVTNLSTEPHII